MRTGDAPTAMFLHVITIITTSKRAIKGVEISPALMFALFISSAVLFVDTAKMSLIAFTGFNSGASRTVSGFL